MRVISLDSLQPLSHTTPSPEVDSVLEERERNQHALEFVLLECECRTRTFICMESKTGNLVPIMSSDIPDPDVLTYHTERLSCARCGRSTEIAIVCDPNVAPKVRCLEYWTEGVKTNIHESASEVQVVDMYTRHAAVTDSEEFHVKLLLPHYVTRGRSPRDVAYKIADQVAKYIYERLTGGMY